ncbi:dihydrolipoyl dehydrogenase [Bacillus massiliigorillae]|uniref:dihydrolipoyl dehydrogenase n=1 Tax=Bacillus massiliigorillae TaxID=1243664 RepID=UPI00039FF7B5|nr:dihydrolipoyl dehydrogenase [Bacillus massiliigorillae]
MVVGEIVIETDVVVIGGGPGGYAAAIRLGQLGKSVVLIEKDQLGGVCLHHGCIPSKTLIHSAEQFHNLPQLEKMGIHIPAEQALFQMEAWQNWKNNIISQLNQGITHLCIENDVTIVKGTATFLSEDRIRVETSNDAETYRFENAIIATGSRPFIPSFIQMDGTYILDSTAALQMQSIPSSLAIIGGGYIGIELGMAFAKLGTRVTIIEMANRILPNISKHLTQEVMFTAKKLGITFETATKVEKVAIENNQVHLRVFSELQQSKILISDRALVTIGRIPNTDSIGLEQAGIQTDEHQYITVDEQCRTNIPHIFAIGDITPGPALAHKAAKQGKVAAEVIGGLPSAMDSTLVPYVIFSNPQIAGVGLTREEAEQQGFSIKTGTFPFRANGRAVATNETQGFAEVIVDAETHLLLGMHIVGNDASNLIGEGVLALELAARVEDIALTIHPHPTLAEGWLEAAEAALGHAIHIVQK